MAHFFPVMTFQKFSILINVKFCILCWMGKIYQRYLAIYLYLILLFGPFKNENTADGGNSPSERNSRSIVFCFGLAADNGRYSSIGLQPLHNHCDTALQNSRAWIARYKKKLRANNPSSLIGRAFVDILCQQRLDQSASSLIGRAFVDILCQQRLDQSAN